MNWLWLFIWCYVAPVLILSCLCVFLGAENPFDKSNRFVIFTPFVNLWEAIVVVLAFLTCAMIEFGDFCEGVYKILKKQFF